MLAANIPIKFSIPWANSAGASYIRTVPVTSQIGIQNGAASLTDGYPPLTFLAAGAGGVSPFGADTNGILKQITQWNQWQSAGGPVQFDSAFSSAVGGYPQGAIVASSTTLGLFWFSLVDNNTSNPDTGGANWTGFQATQTVPAMQGQLTLSSATAVVLNPVNGGLLWINGLNYAIPSGGVNLSNGGLSASTLYYVYAQMVGGVMTLMASATGYAKATNGVPQKTGDATQTLVGMVYTNASSQFLSQDGNLQVLSWAQRGLKRTRTQFSANRSVTSASFAEINTEIRNFFIVWAGENVQFSTTGTFGVSQANIDVATQLSFDSGPTELESCIAIGAQVGGGGGGAAPLAINGTKVGLSEGLHYATLYGATNGGGPSASWQSANSVTAAATSLTISLQG